MYKRIAFVVNSLSGNELSGGENDARSIYEVLTKSHIGDCVPDASKILLNCESRHEFTQQLLDTIANWNPQNQLILYYSGHGELNNNVYNLVFGTGLNKTIIPFGNIINDLSSNGINRAIIILDACRSGTIIQGEKGTTEAYFEAQNLPKGLALIASSHSHELSYELIDKDISLFTHYFVTGLNTGLDGTPTKDNLIGIDDIISYIKNNIDRSEYANRAQRPIYAIKNASESIWVAKNTSKNTIKPTKHVKNRRHQPFNPVKNTNELRLLYQNTESSRHPCINATINDLDWDLIDIYIKNSNNQANIINLSPFEMAKKIGLISPLSDIFLHKAAVLCFANRPDIFIPQARSIVVTGDSIDKLARSQYIVGPLPYQFKQILSIIEHHSASYEHATMPTGYFSKFQNVVREAISNAIAHRDYDSNDVIKIELNSKFIEIYSPGSFPEGIQSKNLLNDQHDSHPKDAAIAWYLTNTLSYEGIGRGFDIFRDYIDNTSHSSLKIDQNTAPRLVKVTIKPPKPNKNPILSSSIMTIPDIETTRKPIPTIEIDNFHIFNESLHENIITDTDLNNTESQNPINELSTLYTLKQKEIFPDIANYRILKHLANGGMSAVYLAEHKTFGTAVQRAIKVISLRFDSQSFIQKFMHEMQANAQLNHPNIIQTFDGGEIDNQLYIVMEYAPGGSLADWILKNCLEYKETSPPYDYYLATARILLDTCKGLEYAHSKNLIHRDLKPDNILFSESKEVKIIDFGISKLINNEIGHRMTHEIIGTPMYMSPESYSGIYSNATDIYSIGVIMYQMLSFKLPFHSNYDRIVQQKIQKISPIEPININNGIPTTLNNICIKAMHPDRDLRYKNTDQLIHDLDSFIKIPDKTKSNTSANPLSTKKFNIKNLLSFKSPYK